MAKRIIENVDEIRGYILEQLAEGRSLISICREDDMPDRRTIQRWQDGDEEFNAAIMRAREDGYALRADKAVLAANTAEDAALGRLAFDAERWYLGKLSNAFSDNKPQKVHQQHTVDSELADWLGLKTS